MADCGNGTHLCGVYALGGQVITISSSNHLFLLRRPYREAGVGYTQIELVCTTSNSEVFPVVPSREKMCTHWDLSWETFIVSVCMKSDRNICIIKHVHTSGQSYRNDRTQTNLNRHQTSSSDGWATEVINTFMDHSFYCSDNIQYILFTNLHILMCIEHLNDEY